MSLNVAQFNPMNQIGHRRIPGDRYADLPPQLRHITLDEADFRPQAALEVLQHRSPMLTRVRSRVTATMMAVASLSLIRVD
jgi:hypothetical protein